MINITIVLIHNKSEKDNLAQIEALKSHLLLLTDHHEEQDPNGNLQKYDTYHYEIKGLKIPHNVKFFQLIPFGVTVDHETLYSIDSYKVFYGRGDEDKIGWHPRFFNHAMRFPIDSMAADVVIHLHDHKTFNIKDLEKHLQKLETHHMTSHSWGHITKKEILIHVGEVDEEKPLEEGMKRFKNKIVQKGLKHG